MDFIYLDESQMLESGVANMRKCNEIIDYMYRLLKRGDYRLGGENNDSHGLRLLFPAQSDIPDMPIAKPGRWFTAMPAYLGGRYHTVGIKCYGANQDNPQSGLPRSVLMLSLLDAETGVPLAYMSANILSAARTGAVSGIFARYLARPNAKKIAVIGPGVMSRYSLDSIMLERPKISEIAVLGRGQKNIDLFERHCNEKGYRFSKYENCSSIEQVCNDADIILTANTQSGDFNDYPHIPQKALKEGALVIIVSALRVDKQTILNDDTVVHVADFVRMYTKKRSIDAKPETSDGTITYKDGLFERISLKLPVLDMADIVTDPAFVRHPDKVYICASSGLPVEDVAWGSECYRYAREHNIGTRLNLWDSSQL